MKRMGQLMENFQRMITILLITRAKYKNINDHKKMKKKRKFLVLSLSLFLLIGISSGAYSQNPPPPPGQHNLTGDQPPQGGNAPIGAGAALLVVMGVVYGLSRIPGLRKDSTE